MGGGRRSAVRMHTLLGNAPRTRSAPARQELLLPPAHLPGALQEGQGRVWGLPGRFANLEQLFSELEPSPVAGITTPAGQKTVNCAVDT